MIMNTFLRPALLFLVAIASSSIAIAQKTPVTKPKLSAEVEAFHASALQKVQPGVRRWITEQAKSEVQKNLAAEAIEPSLRQAVVARFSGLSSAQAEVDMVTLVAYVEMLKSLAQQINDGRKRIEALNVAISSLRLMYNQLEKDVNAAKAKQDADPCMSPMCGGYAMTPPGAQAMAAIGESVITAADLKSVGELRSRHAEVQAKLASLDAAGIALAESLNVLTKRMETLQESVAALMKKVDANEDYVLKTLK